MAPEGWPLTISVPNDLRLIPVIRSFVESACQAAGIDPQTINAVTLATHEAAQNVMRHAHRNAPDAFLQVECRLGAAGIEIRLLDEGEPFDLAAVPHLDPAEIRLGGRGVYLMRALMDELHCGPRGNRGNALRMVKHCRPVSSSCLTAESA